MAETIRELYDSSIEDFLNEETSIFGGVYDLLDQHFARLSKLEQAIIFWLAIEREPISRSELQKNFTEPQSHREFVEAMQSLRRRFLIDRNAAGFTLQNVVMEYITNRLIDQVCQEIMNQSISKVRTHTLIKTQVKDYIRESQTRLILKPITERLRTALGQKGVEDRLRDIFVTLRVTPPQDSGYAAGNVLNLLVQLKSDLSSFDFSQLTVRQAYLAEVTLHDVNFAGAQVTETVFTDTFGGILSLAFSPDGGLIAAAGTTTG